MILILFIIQLSRSNSRPTLKLKLCFQWTMITCSCIVVHGWNNFLLFVFCCLDQSCKTLETVQVASTQNKEAVGSAFHFKQNKTSRECMPGRPLLSMKRLVIIHAEKAKFVFREFWIPLLNKDMNFILEKENSRGKMKYV